MGLVYFLFVYVLGGLTFLPGLVALYFYLAPKSTLSDDNELDEEKPSGELEEKHQSGLEAYKSGWIFVTRDYIESPDEINSNTQLITESNDNKSAYSALYKLVKDLATKKFKDNSQLKKLQPEEKKFLDHDDNDLDELNKDTFALPKDTNSPNPKSYSHHQRHDPQPQHNHQSQNQPQQQIRSSQKKHRYFAVLKHGNLFLYKDQTLKDVKHVIVLAHHFVSIWPRDLTDAQLFTKYSALALINPSKLTDTPFSTNDTFNSTVNTSNGTEISSSTRSSLSSRTTDQQQNLQQQTNNNAPPGTFFIYCENNCDKEDWYFALIRAMKLEKSELPDILNPEKYAETSHFQTKEMINLIQTLYSSEGQLQTKWLNAIIGRWFLAMKNTKHFEDYVYKKLSKKLNKIKKPGFFNQFEITDIQPGKLAPFFTYPKLKEINPDGTVVASCYVTYNGGLSVTIETKVDLTFGTKFTNREVDLVLKITLSKLEGPMLFKLKPPPSGRFWYCYELDPIVNFKIEPLLSSRTLNFNFITNSIEKKFKEAIKESLVYPFWDDIVFFDSSDQLYRAGIWKEPKIDKDETTALEKENTENNQTDNESAGVDEDNSTNKFDDIDAKSELSTSSRSLRNGKFSNTLTDLTKRMKKKSSPSLSNTENSLSVNTNNTASLSASNTTLNKTPSKLDLTASQSPNTNSTLVSSTFKKIGKWYFKDDGSSKKQHDEKLGYTPPEMISSRRAPRKSSSSMTLGSDSTRYTLATEDNKDLPDIESANSTSASVSNTATTAPSLELSNKGTTTTAPVNVISLSNNSTVPSVAVGADATTTAPAPVANSKLTSTPLDNQTPSYNFSRLDNNNEDLSIFSVAYQNAAQIIPSLTPPPLPPRDISDNLSIRSGSLVGEPTISLSQPNSPIRTKTLTRKPPPPKSPLLHAHSPNQDIKDL